LQTMIRAGVIPLEALCSDAHLLWTSCTGERPVNVPGVKDYLLSIAHVHTPRRNRIVCVFIVEHVACTIFEALFEPSKCKWVDIEVAVLIAQKDALVACSTI
jgi:hypothetical protein